MITLINNYKHTRSHTHTHAHTIWGLPLVGVEFIHLNLCLFCGLVNFLPAFGAEALPGRVAIETAAILTQQVLFVDVEVFLACFLVRLMIKRHSRPETIVCHVNESSLTPSCNWKTCIQHSVVKGACMNVAYKWSHENKYGFEGQKLM